MTGILVIPERMTHDLVAFLVGLLITLVGGLVVRRILGSIGFTPDQVPFPGSTEDAWRNAVMIARTGDALGFLERIVFFVALWTKFEVVVAGYLAFKVAAKWAGWQHILKLPEISSPSDVGAPQFVAEVRARNAWGTWVVSRFIIGSLWNMICALAGYGGAKTVSGFF